MSTAREDRRRALYEACCAEPPTRRAEIIHGTLYVFPRPAPRQATAKSVLGGAIVPAFQRGRGGPGGFWILFEPELHLIPFEPMVPDLAGWRVERMPELPETAYFTVVPDWVCEVLSPSTSALNRNEKLPLYAKLGVRHVWLVDPIARSLEVYALGDEGRWREVRGHHGDERVRAAPFDAIEIELAGLWSPPVIAKPREG